MLTNSERFYQAEEKPSQLSGTSIACVFDTTEEYPAGCSKSLSSKAAASEEARRTLRYVETLSDARTKLADFFSILLKQRLLLLKPFDLTHQLLHLILKTDVVEPKQVQAIQKLLSLNLRPFQCSFQTLQFKLDMLPFFSRE
jgi:hypothetical protein